jgi:hypothetical protein
VLVLTEEGPPRPAAPEEVTADPGRTVKPKRIRRRDP